MSIAKITATCSVCGNEFEHKHACRNRSEADQYEVWAAKNITTCPDCLRKIRAADAAAKAEPIIAELNMPVEITGVSEKQISYAIARRNEYIADHADTLAKAAKQLQQFWGQHDEIMEKAAQMGLTTERAVIDRIMRTVGGRCAYVVLTSTSASEILDALNN